jgi:hypothetical protein
MTPEEFEQTKVVIAKTKDTTAINSLIAEVERLRAENEILKDGLKNAIDYFEPCGICSRELYPKDRCVCSEQGLR